MLVCEQCGHHNPNRAKFCGNCAAILVDTKQATAVKGLPPKTIRVGGGNDNDVVLNLPMVSAHHLKLTRLPAQTAQWRVEDLGSTNGTFVDTPDTPLTSAILHQDQDLYLGSYKVPLKRLLRAVDPFLVHGYHYQPFEAEQWTLGLTQATQLGLPTTGITDRHATFEKHERGRTLSAFAPLEIPGKGTLEAGQTTLLHIGSRVALGQVMLILDEDGFWWIENPRPWFLHCDQVDVTVAEGGSEKVILDQADFVFYPGEFCALMGITGAGKSTLMKAITGQLPLSGGNIRLDNLPFHEHPRLFRRDFGYVPQEEIYHKDLTVRQVLTFAAELRVTDREIRKDLPALVETTFDRVGLSRFDGLLDTRVARLSGGQKRRLSLAIELLTKPNILFLDEPTSGLSSEDARLVIALLRNLANEGMIVLVTIHQPSLELYRQFDRAIYLHQGGITAYDGPAYPDALLYADPNLTPSQAQNPDLVLEVLERQSTREIQTRYAHSDYRREYLIQRRQWLKRQHFPEPLPQKPAVPMPLQGSTLFRRTFFAKFQDRMQALTLLGQAPIVACLIALVFAPEKPDLIFENVATVHFLTVFAALFFGCSNGARDICGEWAIFQRERMFDISPIAFLGAKLGVGFAMGLIQCLMLLTIVQSWTHFKAPLADLLPRLTLAAFAGTTLGLFISTIAASFKKSNEIAVALVPIVMLPLAILGGFIQPYKEMPPLTQELADILPARWYLEDALSLEEQHTSGRMLLEGEVGTYSVQRTDYIREPFFEAREATDLAPVLPIGLFCLVLSLSALIGLFR